MNYSPILTRRLEDKPNILFDIGYVFELAKYTKAKWGYVSREKNCVYLSQSEFFCIHKIPLPFIPNSDLIFSIPDGYRDICDTNSQFFIPDLYPMCILPIQYWDMYREGDIGFRYNIKPGGTMTIFDLYDITTSASLPDILYLYKPDDYQTYLSFIDYLDRAMYKIDHLSTGYYFNDLHKNDIIINGFFNQKNTFGSFIVPFLIEGKTIPVYFFKGMINLNKSDKMDGEIMEDRNYKGILYLKLTVKKAKTPIKQDKYGIPFVDTAYYSFININR